MAEEVENRYKNGKIYKLVSNIDDEFYIGSSCILLSKRLAYHKQDAKKEKRKSWKVYDHFNKIGIDNMKIILIENYSCDNKEQLVSRERYWYDTLKPTLNVVRPIATTEEIKEHSKEWREKNKEIIKEKKKTHYELNKETINKKKKENYKDNKNNIAIKRKEWREKHKEKLNEQNRIYRENNKEEIKEKRESLWHCETCNINITYGSKSRHLKTKKHISNIPSTSSS